MVNGARCGGNRRDKSLADASGCDLERDQTMFTQRFAALAALTFCAAATRLAPHPPNFTPIGAIALFGGAHFRNWREALAVTLAAMFASDVVLGVFVYGYGWFHATMPVIYVCFALTVGLGCWLRSRRTLARVAGAVLAASLLFFVVTNFAVWLRGAFYPVTAEGLVACYAAALPYFRNMLAANVLYSAVLFGGFALAGRYLPSLREDPVRVVLSRR